MKIPFARIGSLGGEAGIALTMDDEGSAQLANRHLIDLGHRRIGFIAGLPEYNLSGWRVEGWREEMEAAGLDADCLLVAGDRKSTPLNSSHSCPTRMPSSA